MPSDNVLIDACRWISTASTALAGPIPFPTATTPASPSRIMATTSNVNTRNKPSDNITPASSSANPRVNAGKVVTFNTVGGDQSNNAYQTFHSSNAPQNRTARPSS